VISRTPTRTAVVGFLIILAVLQTGSHLCAVARANDTIPVARQTAAASFTLPKPEKDWTVIFYNAADFQGYNPAEDFARQFRSTNRVHVIMLEDPYDGESTVWHVGGTVEAPILVALETWGEIDMGDRKTFARILTYGTEYFPSQRTMVMMYQHGAGWRGACYDEHPSKTRGIRYCTYLTPREMRQSLEKVGGIDALLFTAPCLMGAIEPVYELRHVTDLYMGSEPRSGFAAWVDTLPDLMALLTDQPDLSLETLAERILASLETRYDPGEFPEGTPEPLRRAASKVEMTAVMSSSHIEALAASLDAFSMALLGVLEPSIEAIRIARNESEDLMCDETVDAFDFARRCQSIPGLEATSLGFQEAIARTITDAIFNEEAFPGAHGLSLFFPFRKHEDPQFGLYNRYSFKFDDERSDYRRSGLSLLEVTHWDEFLTGFYNMSRDPASRDE